MPHTLKIILFLFFVLLFCADDVCIGQLPVAASLSTKKILLHSFDSHDNFIENTGQYGDIRDGYGGMGKIVFGYEGFAMPVLFTPKGLIYLQQKKQGPTEEEREEAERKGLKPKDEKTIERTISMQWENANPAVKIIAEHVVQGYHTYGKLTGKARAFQKIIYKELYPGIDVVYSFSPNKKTGFEYSLVLKPGADISVVKMRYGGDIKSIKQSNGGLLIKSDIDGIVETIPFSFYGETVALKNEHTKIKSAFLLQNNEAGFLFPEGYDKTRAVVIDPFVTATGNLTGINAGKAKDVDFDYAGNIYVTGGGDGNTHKLSKFDASGALQWTYTGTTILPPWSFGPYYGGCVVEKNTGNVYLGQGFNFSQGYMVVRISTTGLYDNYISTGNTGFNENWKMYWNCNSGSPQILVVGGGTSSTLNLGILTPPATNVTPLNITGTSGICCQDMVDLVFDEANFDIYSIFASLGGTPSVNNRMYKHKTPYSAATIAWNRLSGFNTLSEAFNRPYLSSPSGSGGLMDNSANILALNASYLFYWDGKNLEAFDKATGAGVGAPMATSNTALSQGGIIADACNNVFVGEGNGVIKVYKFTGTVFDDAAAPDISIIGFAGKSVYDLAYDESKKLIYASGDGFISSIDVSAYCNTTLYTLNVVPDCIAASATATISPAPPVGSSIIYALFIGNVQIANNTTGVFSGLNPNVTYTIVATINQACSGYRATATFILPGPTIAIASTNTTCGNTTATITATGSATTAPYTYSIDGTTFQASGSFTALAAGVYTVTVKDANGCKSTKVVTLLNSNGPVLSYTATNADCGNNNGTITATVTGGTPPYQYTINGTVYQSNAFFTGLTGGTYTLTVKDANGCKNSAVIIIASSPKPFVNAIPASATCGSSNGTITAFGSGGTAPLQYSINGNIFQSGNVFTNLTPGTYTVTVKDVNGCTNTTTVTLANSPAPNVSATTTSAACNNINGTITATGSGGIAPLQYSINGGVFQTGNVFASLAAGTYTITVKDNTGCTNTTIVTVASTGGPTVTATSTVSACNVNNGTITASAAAGTPGYQYSINGITFQPGNTFNGLAAGSYIVYVRDATGCIGTVAIVVNNTAGPSITATATPTSCSANTGTITATGTGGTAPLQYSIDGITYGVLNTFSGLATGLYTIYVKDANGCIKTITVRVVNVSNLSLAASTISSSCYSGNGTITATSTGGVAPLQYSINGTVYQAGNVFTGIVPGTYTVYVKDANGCIVTQTTVVGSASSIALTVTVPLNATCSVANGVIVASGSGGVAPLNYNIDGGAFQLSGTFLNVAAGTHTLSVKDATGCTISQIVTVTNSGVGAGISTFTVVLTGSYPCNGVLGGRITNPRVNGANCNTCTFSLDFAPFVANVTQLYLNVPNGIHTVTAKDANGCTKTIVVTMTNATLSTAVASNIVGSNCSTSNGSFRITGIGPNTPYHASINGIGGPWITFDPTTNFTGLAPGIYTVIMADDESFDIGPPIVPGGCIDSIHVIVPSIGGPSIAATTTAGSCGLSNGNITATGSLGVAPYTYSINGGSYFASGVFNNLAAGVYAVRVKDNTGCIAIKNVTVTTTASPVVTAFSFPASCNMNNGSITATGTGGTGLLQYSIDALNFQNSNIFTNLAAGSYTVYVKDSNQCFATVAVVVAKATLPKVTAFSIAASCNNNDGSIITTGSLGTPPYTFSVNGTVYQSSTTFSGLAAGFYAVYIKDARGCVTTTGISLGNLAAPSITGVVVTAANCSSPTGTLVVTANGGVAPLQYSINGTTFQAATNFGALPSGNYTITVKDANGCVATKTVFVGNNLGPQVLNAVVINAACGLNNGNITASASGGIAPFQFSIDGITYQAGTIFGGVGAGSYTLSVKDVNGCQKTLPVSVINLPGPALSLSTSPTSCGTNDGTITATATGGTGTLSYSKDGITFQASNIFLNLASGPYTIIVKDARGCTDTANISVTIAGTATTPTFNAVPAICSGGVLSALPTTSLNGITGTWSPALSNTTTTLYTFTPNAGQCATTATLTITVHPKPTPIIIYHN